MTYQFSATIEKIGINSFLFIPENILKSIFEQAGKDKGSIPIKGEVNGKHLSSNFSEISRRLVVVHQHSYVEKLAQAHW